MSDLSVLVGGRPRGINRAMSARGKVLIAPESGSDNLRVALVNYSSEFFFEVPGTNWLSRGSALPQVDDVCLVVFDDDGDAWVPVWEGTSVANTELPFALWGAFGAVGDGVTDDTAAVLAAVSHGATGSRSYGASGRYVVGDLLLPHEGLTLEGSGIGFDPVLGLSAGTTLKAREGATWVLKNLGKRYQCIRDMIIDGTADGVSRAASGLLTESTGVSTSQSHTLERVMFFRCLEGMRIGGGGLTQADKNTLQDCHFIECDVGLINSSPNGQETLLINPNFGSNYGEANLLMSSGCLSQWGGQYQAGGAPVGIKFIGPDDGGLGWVNLKDVIFEGPDIDIDGTAHWPYSGVLAEQVVFQGRTANVILGVPYSTFTGRHCRFNDLDLMPSTGGGKIRVDAENCTVVLESSGWYAPTIEINAPGCTLLLIDMHPGPGPIFTGAFATVAKVVWLDQDGLTLGVGREVDVSMPDLDNLKTDVNFSAQYATMHRVWMGDLSAIVGGSRGGIAAGSDLAAMWYRNTSTQPTWRSNIPMTGPSYATGSRPSASDVPVGTCIYDSTLGIPIWSSGSAWKNAAGVVV